MQGRKLDTGRLLQFIPEGEEELYQQETSYRRLRSPHRVDAALFFALALFMATGWQRVYNAGHSNEIPYMLLSGILYSCCTLLYVVRGTPGGLLEFLQQKMRLKLHIIVYAVVVNLFTRHIGLPNMGACSPFKPSFSAFEALVVYLLWTASYPLMAGIPLRYSIFLQIGTFFTMDTQSSKQCMMGDACSQTDYMYDLYAWGVDVISSAMPILGPDGIQGGSLEQQDKFASCRAMMCFAKLFVLVGISAYMTYMFEVRSRLEYIIKNGKSEHTVMQLMKKQPTMWQHAVEILLMGIVSWHVVRVYLDPLRAVSFHKPSSETTVDMKE